MEARLTERIITQDPQHRGNPVHVLHEVVGEGAHPGRQGLKVYRLDHLQKEVDKEVCGSTHIWTRQ